jgi:hypothetical protein
MRSFLLGIVVVILAAPALAADDLEHYFRFMGFQLEKTELSEIRKELGDAPIHQEGDAANSYTAICYRIPQKNITVYFESGEMGGSRTLLGYRVVKEAKPDFPCGHSRKEIIENYNIGALVIGNNFDKTIGLLPSGVKAQEGYSFIYLTKIPFTNEEIKRLDVRDMKYAYWDQSVTIVLYPRESTLSGYRVTKVTSW